MRILGNIIEHSIKSRYFLSESDSDKYLFEREPNNFRNSILKYTIPIKLEKVTSFSSFMNQNKYLTIFKIFYVQDAE